MRKRSQPFEDMGGKHLAKGTESAKASSRNKGVSVAGAQQMKEKVPEGDEIKRAGLDHKRTGKPW